MKKIIGLIALGLFSLNSFALEYEANPGTSKLNNIGRTVFFNNANTTQPMDVFFHNGKYYLAGNSGDNYEINVCNKQPRFPQNSPRKLFIVSVDGLNVVSGDPANYNQSGYVVSNGDCTKIKGWRKNMNEEARFVLTNQSSSYNAKTNNDQRNIGVIGIAVFDEYREPQPTPMISEESKRSMNSAMPAASPLGGASAMQQMDIMAKQEKLGTGHGERIVSEAQKTEFKKASNSPSQVITLYYDSYDNLVAKGIISSYQYRPNPFPGEQKFAPDPMK